MDASEPPSDAAFTLTEMGVSLFLSVLVILVVAEMARQVSRTYSSVRADVTLSQDNRLAASWVSQFSRADNGSVSFQGHQLDATIGARDVYVLRAEDVNILAVRNRDGRTVSVPLSISALQVGIFDRSLFFFDGSTPTPVYAIPIDRTVPWNCRFDTIGRTCR